jgi:hypothetical protein
MRRSIDTERQTTDGRHPAPAREFARKLYRLRRRSPAADDRKAFARKGSANAEEGRRILQVSQPAWIRRVGNRDDRCAEFLKALRRFARGVPGMCELPGRFARDPLLERLVFSPDQGAQTPGRHVQMGRSKQHDDV